MSFSSSPTGLAGDEREKSSWECYIHVWNLMSLRLSLGQHLLTVIVHFVNDGVSVAYPIAMSELSLSEHGNPGSSGS